jgi:hypothetical protein
LNRISLYLVAILTLWAYGCKSGSPTAPSTSETINLATIPLSDGGIAPAASVMTGLPTIITVEQNNKYDGLMEGCYYGYFFDQWPWQGGSGGSNTTLGPNLSSGLIYTEVDVCVSRAELRSGRLRFSIAIASWENRGVAYKHTEYDFWNGPELNSGIVWTDTVRIFKGPQLEVGKLVHLSLNISEKIDEAYAMTTGYLQAVYLVIEWDGNNSSELQFKNFKLYRRLS